MRQRAAFSGMIFNLAAISYLAFHSRPVKQSGRAPRCAPQRSGQRIGDTLGRVDTALMKIEELRGDLKPTLDNTAAIIDHLRGQL